jgi:uncharacterized NAD(P)/FAD-binding protein YdhS
MNRHTTRIAVIGAGPRGIAVALRLLDERPERAGGVVVHLVDPVPGGAVWDPRQDPHLLMNSRGRQATVFADDSVAGVEGDSRGPSFIEWAHGVAPTLPISEESKRQAAQLDENGFAGRALFGEYLQWVVAGLAAANPERLRVHAARATDVEELADGGHRVTLDDAADPVLEVDAVVLATGHLPMPASAREQGRADFAERHRLYYLPPRAADPAELAGIPAGEQVAVLGAGLNFYDVMALLTEGRGGSYSADADGSLRYAASGEEPVLLVGSGRGIPYMARATTPLPVRLEVLSDEVLAGWLAEAGTLSFSRDVWPVLVEELELAWSSAGAAEPLDIEAMIDPYAAALSGTSPSGSELTAVLRGILHSDAESAAAAPRGPATAVGETLAVLKDRVRTLVAAGAFDADSVLVDLGGWFRSVGAFIAAGPPLRRVREAVALIDAGLLRALGADARLMLDENAGTFLVATRETAEPFAVSAVVEARLGVEDARSTTDALVPALLRRGLARSAALPAAGGARATEGLEVVRTTGDSLLDGTACRLVAADGTQSPRRFLLGLPVQPQEWNIANLPQPGRGDRTLTQAESIAGQVDALSRLLHQTHEGHQ